MEVRKTYLFILRKKIPLHKMSKDRKTAKIGDHQILVNKVYKLGPEGQNTNPHFFQDSLNADTGFQRFILNTSSHILPCKWDRGD